MRLAAIRERWQEARAVARQEEFLHWEAAFPGVWRRRPRSPAWRLTLQAAHDSHPVKQRVRVYRPEPGYSVEYNSPDGRGVATPPRANRPSQTNLYR